MFQPIRVIVFVRHILWFDASNTFPKSWDGQQKAHPISVFSLIYLSLVFLCLSPSPYPEASPSPAVSLLTLSMCAVNNWWSSPTQRVTGPREMSHQFLHLFTSLSLSSLSPSSYHTCSVERGDRWACISSAVAVIAVCGRSCTCDHEWVNAACLADSRTEEEREA